MIQEFMWGQRDLVFLLLLVMSDRVVIRSLYICVYIQRETNNVLNLSWFRITHT